MRPRKSPCYPTPTLKLAKAANEMLQAQAMVFAALLMSNIGRSAARAAPISASSANFGEETNRDATPSGPGAVSRRDRMSAAKVSNETSTVISPGHCWARAAEVRRKFGQRSALRDA